MTFLTEDDIEKALIARFGEFGYANAPDAIIGPDGTEPERSAYDDVILRGRRLDTSHRHPTPSSGLRQQAEQHRHLPRQ